MKRNLIWIAAFCAMFGQASADIQIEPVVTGLDEPWGLAFLPKGGFLITERDGALYAFEDGKRTRVSGIPKVFASGQGGLLDVMIPRDFAKSREVFLSYAKPQPNDGAGTALGVGRLSENGRKIIGFRDIFEMKPGGEGGRHFGSRIVEGEDGAIYLTIGDRGDRPSAQDLSRTNGSVVRVERSGNVPNSNPFTGDTASAPAIWSYGHRNPQGAALDARGRLWVVEHGAKGGDELNLVQKGANYGWPVISYGTHYSGKKIGVGVRKEGMQQPAHFWDPSIAPSGLMFYSGALWPEWEGDAFVGSLKFDMISRLEVSGSKAREQQRIEAPETNRVRDVREAPDGSIWFLSVGEGAVYRMTPE